MVSFLFGEFHREHSLGEEKEWGNNREKKKKNLPKELRAVILLYNLAKT